MLEVTFDGDLIDLIRATYVLRAIHEQNLMENVRVVSAAFLRMLSDWTLNPRAAGALIAFDLPNGASRDGFVRGCFENGILVNRAGERTIRLRPHLAFAVADVPDLRIHSANGGSQPAFTG